MQNSPSESDLLRALRQHFGYDSFRPLQLDIIQHALSGRDAVVLMPTGGGKSICYQLPALVRPGLTVVISPLIALMKDQVDALRANGIAAACLNSSLTLDEFEAVAKGLTSREIDLLYLSPERLFSGGCLSYLATLDIGLFAVDEAHCVSSWGHHFRPEYQRLNIIKEHFPDTPVMALTATADKAVRSDIGESLGLVDPALFVASFDRPNLSMTVLPGRKKWEQLLPLVRRYPRQGGIIYCQSRNGTEGLAKKLQEHGFEAQAYHAGLDTETRNRVQSAFIQGDCPIVCATIAFGMGIDKADVRFVVHWNMPGNIESYYQEIGRAGRDGLPAETVLFYSYRDVQTQLGFLEDIIDDSYRDIQQAKIKRIQDFAEAQVCRRKILLGYFSEIQDETCGNCDVCRNPPSYMDGTTAAQMALSAVIRTKERCSITTLIDILKGSRSPSVVEAGFDKIKTFGVGRLTTNFTWQLFIQQLIQLGLLELDYKDNHRLKLTSLSRPVLFEGRKVDLVSPETIKERQEEQKKIKVSAQKAIVGPLNKPLYESLCTLRTEIATRIGKPAYVVFSNASLEDMAARLPKDRDEFLGVHGVGEHKAQLYADLFLKAIADFSDDTAAE
ncbi:MAG: DNA helicase RecQ [Ectothiorhodospiraceae bacterium AqS1]|nr:DNA helicase RecQ [Ectothiorhodospiraceae bacterium AqS1]